MDHDGYLGEAYEQAIIARNRGDVPVGAIIVIEGEIIGKKGNMTETNKDYFFHAENLLIQEYGDLIRKSKKEHISIYSTLEPCLQCFGALVHNRFKLVYFACQDPVAGSVMMEPPTP